MIHDPVILSNIGAQLGMTPAEVEGRITEYEVGADGSTVVYIDTPATEADLAEGCDMGVSRFAFDPQGQFESITATRSCWPQPKIFTFGNTSLEFAQDYYSIATTSEDGCVTESLLDYWSGSTTVSTTCPVSSETLWLPTGRGYDAVFHSNDPEAIEIVTDRVSQLAELTPERLSEMSYEELRELHNDIYLTEKYVDFIDSEDKTELYAAVERAEVAVNAEIEELIRWNIAWLPENNSEFLNGMDLESLRLDHESILSIVDDIRTLLGTEGNEELIAGLEMLDGNIDGRILILEDAGASSSTSCDEL